MITIMEYDQNLVRLLYFNSFVATKISLHYDCFNKDSDAFTPLSLRVVLIVSACFYMDMNNFGLVRVVSSWLRVGSVAVDSFGWVIADNFGWLQMVSGGFGWFRVVSGGLLF